MEVPAHSIHAPDDDLLKGMPAPGNNLEQRRSRMLAAGDELLAALARENRWNRTAGRRPSHQDVETLKAIRREVDRLALAYAAAVKDYRRAMEDAVRKQ